MIEVGPLETSDRSAWEGLARGYKAFYRDWIPDEVYEATWRRLRRGTELYGLGARIDGRLIGIAHYFFHPTFWSGDACYLQDLFVEEAVRGRGAARALIDAVAAAAREHGASRYYWHTQDDNTTARALYDKVARFSGFIRYQYPLLRTSRPALSICGDAASYRCDTTRTARPGGGRGRRHQPVPRSWRVAHPAGRAAGRGPGDGRGRGPGRLPRLPPGVAPAAGSG